MRMRYPALLMALMMMTVITYPAWADSPANPTVDGVLGLESESAGGWLAIGVAVPDDHALAGILWYNNDGLVNYPTLSVGTGHAGGPGSLSAMVSVAEQVSGTSSDWSELAFSQPVGATQGKLFLVFEFPAGGDFQAEGEGGGPAIGYCAGDQGTPGWVSGDGEFWMPLHEESGFAVRPVLVPLEEGMMLKSMDGDDGANQVPVASSYLATGPNPFNPITEIKFGLERSSDVVIDVYNLRGARVVRLVDEAMAAGHHSVRWTGTDAKGRRVASGAYFARLIAGDVTLTKRMMLIK